MSPKRNVSFNQYLSTMGAPVSAWSPELVPGPCWSSFEQFRVGGNAALGEVVPGSVGTLRCKTATYRVLRDEDFQNLLGLASEVHRLKQGVTFVAQAAKVVAKHKDQESMELLFHSVSMLAESKVLPDRDGHALFAITDQEVADNVEDNLDLEPSDIPRPSLK